MGAAIAPLMEDFFKDTGFDRKHHNFHYTPGLLLSEVEDPLKYIEHKKKLFDQVYPKQYVTGNELTTIKENSGIQGLIIATCYQFEALCFFAQIFLPYVYSGV